MQIQVYQMLGPATLRVWIPKLRQRATLKLFRAAFRGQPVRQFTREWLGRQLEAEIEPRPYGQPPIVTCRAASPHAFPPACGRGLLDGTNIARTAAGQGLNPGAAVFAAALTLRLHGLTPEVVVDGGFNSYLPQRSVAFAISRIHALPDARAHNFASGSAEADQYLLQSATVDSTVRVISHDKFGYSRDRRIWWPDRFPLPHSRRQLVDYVLSDQHLAIPALGPDAQAPLLDFFRALDAGEIRF